MPNRQWDDKAIGQLQHDVQKSTLSQIDQAGGIIDDYALIMVAAQVSAPGFAVRQCPEDT